MTTREAQRVLAVLTAAWPRESVTEATAKVWFDALGDIDAEAGLQAANLIVRSDEWFPPIARFRSTAISITKRRQLARVALPSGEAPIDRDQAAANVRKIKAALNGVVAKTSLPGAR